MKGKENKLTPVPFEKLQHDLPPVLYNSEAIQDVSYMDERHTAAGRKEILAAHRLNPLTDKRFFEREKEFAEQSKNKSLSTLNGALPTEKLWSDLCAERIGYKPREDWKGKVKAVDKINVVSALTHIVIIEDQADVLEDEFLIDEDEKACLKFRVYFGGFTLEQWREWFGKGHFPENLVLTEDSYESSLAKLQKDIMPNVLLIVAFYFKEVTKKQMDEALSMLFALPNPNKLASAAREEKTLAERWFALYKEVLDSYEGYLKEVPAFHAIAATQSFFVQESARLGKSLIN